MKWRRGMLGDESCVTILDDSITTEELTQAYNEVFTMTTENDPWAKYSPEVREQLKHSPAIIDAINTMIDNGHDKDHIKLRIGAPYELIDKLWQRRRGRAISKESGPRREEED